MRFFDAVTNQGRVFGIDYRGETLLLIIFIQEK